MYREESAAPVHGTWLVHQNTLFNLTTAKGATTQNEYSNIQLADVISYPILLFQHPNLRADAGLHESDIRH